MSNGKTLAVSIRLTGIFAQAFLKRKKAGEPDTSVIREMLRETPEYKELEKKSRT